MKPVQEQPKNQRANGRKILHIDASGRQDLSVTRKLSNAIVKVLASDQTSITYRDVSQGLPYVDELLIGAYYTVKEERSAQQLEAIALSDQIVKELKQHDCIVIGLPVYNFSMPAGFKAWCDLAARVGETFKYTDNGPVGLLCGKKVYVAVASGGTQIGGEIDYLTPWLRHFLAFIGISEVEIITAEKLNQQGDSQIKQAQAQISALSLET